MKKTLKKQKKINNKGTNGITLIALVITIIVLLILAGISISMLSGDNSILSKVGEARNITKETQKDEEVKVAVLGSYNDRANLDIDKLLSNLNKIKDITVTPTQENGKNTFPVTVKTEYTTYKITSDGKFEKVVIVDRTGISVGDYITYISPTESVTFTDADTGYSNYASTPKTLPAKDTFRVMDIDKYGNMTLIGAMTSSDKTIYFSGAKGYNNAVYSLNEKCSELYKDVSKGITARSIKVEDITSKFNDNGNGKITTYISNQISSLSPSTNVTKNKNEDDEFDNTVTYKNGYTSYPDIFQYESGGLIDSTATSGVIGQSESYSGYGGLTTLTNKTPKPTNLTVPYTYYNTSHTEEDFKDSAKAAVYQNLFFGTGIYYWLASRCIGCNPTIAFFRLRLVNNSNFNARDLCDSYGGFDDGRGRVCPIVYIPSNVVVEISPNPKNQSNTSGTAHVVK